MQNKYIFVIDYETGERLASLNIGLHANNSDKTLAKAQEMFPKADYPNAIFQYGDDDMQHAFYDGKIFKDGNMIDKPPVVKSNEQILREKRAEIEQEYLPRLDAIKGGITARLAQGQDITELQNQYKTVLAEMTKKLNSVTVS